MKIESYLPRFSGFYETAWQLDFHYIEDFFRQSGQRNDKAYISQEQSKTFTKGRTVDNLLRAIILNREEPKDDSK